MLFLFVVSCTARVTPPLVVADPVTVWIVAEELHRGLVLPAPEGHVEFGYGEWAWYAEGADSWYRVPPALFWPTGGTLARRRFSASGLEELRRRHPGLRLQAVVVERARSESLRRSLEERFAEGRSRALHRDARGMEFVPDERGYWLGFLCADAVADWLERLGCEIGWSWIRLDLSVEPHPALAPGRCATRIPE